jgi:hypothetical protein
MLRIDITTIAHWVQRYPTVGDYWTGADGTSHIRVSDMGDWRYELLVAVHEMVEQAICRQREISEDDITAFDVAFEANRPDGNTSEPGNDIRAPYYKEHQFATFVERAVASELGVDWEAYSKFVNEL